MVTHRDFLTSIVAKQKIEREPFEDKEEAQIQKGGKSHSAEKSGKRGTFCFGMVLYFMCTE